MPEDYFAIYEYKYTQKYSYIFIFIFIVIVILHCEIIIMGKIYIMKIPLNRLHIEIRLIKIEKRTEYKKTALFF